jgi:nucleotide-binding universal stress UspA family protein
VLYVLDYRRFAVSGSAGVSWSPYLGRDSARRLVAKGVERARAAGPELRVSGEVRIGRPVGVLVAATNRAELMVLGTRGRGEVHDLVVGSLTASVAAHGRCPVVIVHRDGGVVAGPGHPVVVGVKGGPTCRAALAFAARCAAENSALLIVVRAWNTLLRDAWVGVDAQVLIDRDDLLAWERRRGREDLDAAVAWVGARFPELAVRASLVEAAPAAALLGAAEDPGLVVVGASGQGALASLTFGGVSHSVMHRATRPVAVVPDRMSLAAAG